MRTTTRINAITLGGKAVASLDSGGYSGGPISEAEFGVPLPEKINMDLLMESVGIAGTEERAYAVAFYADQLRGHQLQQELGWSKNRVLAVRQRVARRLDRFDTTAYEPNDFVVHGSSLKLSYRECLSPGRSCYSLTELGGEFARVMAEERRFANKKPKICAKSFAA